MGFIKAIIASIYSPKFYADALQKGLDRALGYFLLLILLLTVFSAAPYIYSFATDGQSEISKMLTKVSSQYPKELEVKITNGQVTTNVTEPYIITAPEDFTSDNQNYNLVVIDTTTPFSLDQFEKYNSFAWLSKDVVYIKGNGNEFRAYDLADFDDLTINRSQVDKLLKTVSPWISMLTPIVGVFIFIGILIAYTFRLAYMFFLAFCIYVLAQFMKKPLTYKESYKIGLYAITLSLIVEIIQRLNSSLHIPFLFTIVALLVVFANLRHVKLSSKKATSKK